MQDWIVKIAGLRFDHPFSLMIPYSKQDLTDRDISEVTRVLKSDLITQGPEVQLFEDALKAEFSVGHAVACSSGTAALHLSYAALGVDSQSVGVVPAITFSATANAFRYLGAQVRFCDINPQTGLICLESLESILGELPVADAPCPGIITPVSFAGSIAPLSSVQKLADSIGFKTIEDASHSPGAFSSSGTPLERSCSSIHTEAACVSFHPVKHICCGEGGVVLTNNQKLATIARHLRSHGIERPNDDNHETPWYYQQNDLGWNYRLTDIQSALGRSQLERLAHQLKLRRKIAERYEKALMEYPFNESLMAPPLEEGHSWHLYIIRFKEPTMRDKAHKYLKSEGIMTQVHYVPLYRHPYYENMYGKIRLPGAEKFYQSCLSIPMFPNLSEKDQDHVINSLKHFCLNS